MSQVTTSADPAPTNGDGSSGELSVWAHVAILIKYCTKQTSIFCARVFVTLHMTEIRPIFLQVGTTDGVNHATGGAVSTIGSLED